MCSDPFIYILNALVLGRDIEPVITSNFRQRTPVSAVLDFGRSSSS